MLPCKAMHNHGDGTTRDGIFFHQRSVCPALQAKMSKFRNFFICHFGVSRIFSITNLFGMLASPMRISARVSFSSFGNAIADILDLSSKKKMIWIHARAVVAFMQYLHRFISRSSMKQIVRNAMSANRTPLIAIHPIAIWIKRGGPRPTFSKFWDMIRNGSVFVDALPKNFDWITVSGHSKISVSGDAPSVATNNAKAFSYDYISAEVLCIH